MKASFSCAVVAFTFFSCSLYSQQVDLKVPDKVNVTKSPQHENIPETQLFFVKPDQSKFDKSSNRFQIDKTKFVSVLSYPNRDVDSQIIGFKESMKELAKKGAVAYYQKDFLINNNKAWLVYSPSDKAGLEQISLVTGNNQNTYLVKGYFPAQNEELRNVMLKSLLTTLVDNTVKPKVAMKYSLDFSKSPYKLNDVDGDTHYYTVNGKGNLRMNYVQNQIMLQTLPAMPSFEARKQYNDSMIERFKGSLKISSLSEKEVIINGLKGLESTYVAAEKGNPVSSNNYQLVIGNENVTIFLTGMAYTNKDIAVNQIREFIKTLKLN